MESVTKTLTDALDMAIHVPIDNPLAKAPTVILKPNAQRSSGTADAGWRYRMPVEITNTTGRVVENLMYAIELEDTDDLVTAGDALASGNDLRVVFDGQEIPRTLVSWNSALSRIWIIIPHLLHGESFRLELWYGNASAGAPVTLDADRATKPAIALATSTNAVLKYPIDDIDDNAGLGGYGLDSGTLTPNADTSVPGAWRFVTTRESPDAYWQDRYSTYVDGATYYHAIFRAFRARQAGLSPSPESVPAEGLAFYHPGGIESIKVGIEWLNDYVIGESGEPIGRVCILKSGNGITWEIAESWDTAQTTLATVSVADYAISPAAPYVAFAVWPYSDSGRISTNATHGHFAYGAWHTTLEVTVDDSGLTATLGAAEEIYEYATELRLGGDTERVAPYTTIYIGGDRTRRVASLLTECLLVDLETHRAEVWSAALTEKIADAPVRAILGRQMAEGMNFEHASEVALDFRPYINPLPNPSFSADLAGWSRGAVAAGVTAAAQNRDTATFKTTPASLRTQITASTAASDITAIAEVADAYLPIAGRSRVSAAADQRTDNANLQPALSVWFYDASEGFLSQSVAEDWTPAANAWYRRVHSAPVPRRAAFYRVGSVIATKSANQTGSIWSDDVSPGGNELIVIEAALNSLDVTVEWQEQFG